MTFKEIASKISKALESHKLNFDPDKLIGTETKETKPKTDESENHEPIDPDKLIEPAQNKTKQAETERPPIEGGGYRDVKKNSNGESHEVHHMPAADVNGLAFQDGPAIKMEKGDHRQTASCGNSLEARAYREKQAELIKEGKFREAMQMDIDDIHEKFGDKYDDAIAQMTSYAEEKGLI